MWSMTPSAPTIARKAAAIFGRAARAASSILGMVRDIAADASGKPGTGAMSLPAAGEKNAPEPGHRQPSRPRRRVAVLFGPRPDPNGRLSPALRPLPLPGGRLDLFITPGPG